MHGTASLSIYLGRLKENVVTFLLKKNLILHRKIKAQAVTLSETRPGYATGGLILK